MEKCKTCIKTHCPLCCDCAKAETCEFSGMPYDSCDEYEENDCEDQVILEDPYSGIYLLQ